MHMPEEGNSPRRRRNDFEALGQSQSNYLPEPDSAPNPPLVPANARRGRLSAAAGRVAWARKRDDEFCCGVRDLGEHLFCFAYHVSGWPGYE